ncbi:hypothetical protein AB6A40_001866 [Gnathostoma spinigerum]|uniref:Tr-type G domain-containing protein n=1 Tax=Gnathostoma spinigerum TaxID=75299 RepID=A0ABD6EF55_9BILA
MFMFSEQLNSMNIGILGHVDCGKTTLAIALSSLGSTAAFDKHAKTSNLRANTIDLGFSMMKIAEKEIALIDCPGHASLIRSVLAAASVFDMAIIVIDASKGVELQTAEHLLLVSLICPEHFMIVLNKIDLVEPKQIKEVEKRVRKTLKQLKLNENAPVVAISLLDLSKKNAESLFEAIRMNLFEPVRRSSNQFVMNIDHCFPLKGKGIVMTGTAVDGCCSIGNEVEFPALNVKAKVKGIQRWKEDISCVNMGERAALLFRDLPPCFANVDRTVVCRPPGVLCTANYLLVSLKPISFFKTVLRDRCKLSISVGFELCTATSNFLKYDGNDEYEQLLEMTEAADRALLLLEKPIHTRPGTFCLASKLDHQGKGCRFAFHGEILQILPNALELKRYHKKERMGKVERAESEHSLICTSLFKKETNIKTFIGMTVVLSNGQLGTIESPFGKAGKVRLRLHEGLKRDPSCPLNDQTNSLEVHLYMKKYLNSESIVSFIPPDACD